MPNSIGDRKDEVLLAEFKKGSNVCMDTIALYFKALVFISCEPETVYEPKIIMYCTACIKVR